MSGTLYVIACAVGIPLAGILFVIGSDPQIIPDLRAYLTKLKETKE